MLMQYLCKRPADVVGGIVWAHNSPMDDYSVLWWMVVRLLDPVSLCVAIHSLTSPISFVVSRAVADAAGFRSIPFPVEFG